MAGSPDDQTTAAVIDAIGALVVVLSRDGRVVRFNHAAEACTGWSAAEVEGKPFWDTFLLPDEARGAAEVLQIPTASEFPNAHETHWLTKSGERRLIAWSNTAITNAQGEVAQVVTTGLDVTDQRRAEAELAEYQEHLEALADERTRALTQANADLELERDRLTETGAALAEGEARYRALLDALPQYIFLKDCRSVYQIANRSYAKLLGVRPEDMPGTTDHEHYPPDLAEKYRADDQRIMAAGEVEELEEAFEQDGQRGWVRTFKVPLRGKGGEMIGILGIFWDVTELHEAQHQLRERVKEMRALLYLSELAEQHGDNPAAIVQKLATHLPDAWQYPEAACTRIRLDGETAASQGFVECDDKLVEPIRVDGETVGEIEVGYREPRPDADVGPFLTEESMLLHALAERLGHTVARIRAVRLARRAADELRRSNKELEYFAYVASHDLQEPLRKITSFGELLQSAAEELTGDNRLYLDRIVASAERMEELIDALLAYSRVATRSEPFVPVELGTLAREALEDLEMAVKEAGARVDIGPLPLVAGDPAQLRSVFQNLIGNAIKYAREGVPAEITVAGQVAGDMAEITVTDNGIGFDEKYLDRVFKPFQRLHGRHEYAGTGMGLAICERIAKRHGGDIAAVSRLGQGSTFTLRLPMVRAREDDR